MRRASELHRLSAGRIYVLSSLYTTRARLLRIGDGVKNPFRKRWYIVKTNLYFVSHDKEDRTYYGPFDTELDASRSLQHLFNSTAKYQDNKEKVEYYVVCKFPATIYGVTK